jgi:hypothetical protein
MSDLNELLALSDDADIKLSVEGAARPRAKSPDAARLRSMEGRLNKAEDRNKRYRKTLKAMQTAICELHVRATYIPLTDDKLVEQVDTLMFLDIDTV